MTAGDVLTRAAEILQDETNLQFPTSTLLTHLNDGQREIVDLKPDVGAVKAVGLLASGVKQELHSTGRRVLTVTKNMTAP